MRLGLLFFEEQRRCQLASSNHAEAIFFALSVKNAIKSAFREVCPGVMCGVYGRPFLPPPIASTTTSQGECVSFGLDVPKYIVS